MNISLLQTNIKYADPAYNGKRVSEMIKTAMAAEIRPDILVLPEDWRAGFSDEMFNNIENYTEKPDGPSTKLMQQAAKDNNVWIVAGSVAMEFEDGNRNTTFLINRNGKIVGDYSKMHLYSDMDEDNAFLFGDKSEVYNTEFGKIGMMNCYDIRFCELSRSYALKGAEALIVVSNFPNPRLHHWKTLLTARAIENQMFVVACNRVGPSPMGTYCGHSLIIDPWGIILAEGSDEEEIVSGTIQLSDTEEIRETIHMFRDRRPEYYSKLLTEKNK